MPQPAQVWRWAAALVACGSGVTKLGAAVSVTGSESWGTIIGVMAAMLASGLGFGRSPDMRCRKVGSFGARSWLAVITWHPPSPLNSNFSLGQGRMA